MSAPNKFDLQIANDLFQKYERTNDPAVLGKINDLKLDVMKRSAEGELAKLEVPKSRAEIEREMDDPRMPHAFKNEKLSYVLVTYIQNVEKLAQARQQEVGMVSQETRAKTVALKAEIEPPSDVPEGKMEPDAVLGETLKLPVYDPFAPVAGTAPRSEPKPPAPEGVRVVDTPLDRDEMISRNFIAANRKEIEELIGKIPNPNSQEAMRQIIKGPTKQKV